VIFSLAAQVQVPEGVSPVGAGLLAVCAAFGARYYAGLARRISDGVGKVNAQPLGILEAVFAATLANALLLLSVAGFHNGPQVVTKAGMFRSSEFFGLIVLAVILMLKLRGQSLRELFGFFRVGIFPLIGRALLSLLAAFPLVAALNLLMTQFMHGKEDLQEIVKFFMKADEAGDRASLIAVVVLAGVVAPFFEEIVFRGFFYGVAKRYLGMVPAIIIVSLLFGLVHTNLPSLPGLVLLSACFCIAYEFTGSLFTTMIMHSVFNLSSLAAMMLMMHAKP